MILLTRDTRILLGVQPADFRKGIDGFQGLCRAALGQDPTDGTLYVFINRANTMIRALAYHESGFWLMTKRLSRGRFKGWPTIGEPLSPSSAEALRALLGGGTWAELGTPSASPVAARAPLAPRPKACPGSSTCATVDAPPPPRPTPLPLS